MKGRMMFGVNWSPGLASRDVLLASTLSQSSLQSLTALDLQVESETFWSTTDVSANKTKVSPKVWSWCSSVYSLSFLVQSCSGASLIRHVWCGQSSVQDDVETVNSTTNVASDTTSISQPSSSQASASSSTSSCGNTERTSTCTVTVKKKCSRNSRSKTEMDEALTTETFEENKTKAGWIFVIFILLLIDSIIDILQNQFFPPQSIPNQLHSPQRHSIFRKRILASLGTSLEATKSYLNVKRGDKSLCKVN